MEIVKISNIEGLIMDFNNRKKSNILIQKDFEVISGIVSNDMIKLYGNKKLDKEHIFDIRVFNKWGELHIWKMDNEYFYRIKVDNFDIDTDKAKNASYLIRTHNIYVEYPYIFGNNVRKLNNGWVMLEESGRGLKIAFPYEVNYNQLPLRYKVYNYYNFDDTGNLYFYDARLCGFYDDKFNELESV